MERVSTFLMFDGSAEEAVRFYVELFDDAAIEKMKLYGPADSGPAGKVYQAVFTLKGQRFIAFDSPVKHEFGFTPSVSVFVDCDSREEVERLAAGLGDRAEVLMPLDSYPHAVSFTWLNDRFGLSWQLCHERD